MERRAKEPRPEPKDEADQTTAEGKEPRAKAHNPPTQPQETTAEGETREETATQTAEGGTADREPQNPTDEAEPREETKREGSALTITQKKKEQKINKRSAGL
jgi:hypothetical protein